MLTPICSENECEQSAVKLVVWTFCSCKVEDDGEHNTVIAETILCSFHATKFKKTRQYGTVSERFLH